MRIIKANEVELTKGGAVQDLFLGDVERRNLVDGESLRVGLNAFSTGAITKPHTHTFEQVLYVTEGKCLVATDDEEHILTPGMVAFIPANENHWHGATKEMSCTHLTIMTPGKTIF